MAVTEQLPRLASGFLRLFPWRHRGAVPWFSERNGCFGLGGKMAARDVASALAGAVGGFQTRRSSFRWPRFVLSQMVLTALKTPNRFVRWAERRHLGTEPARIAANHVSPNAAVHRLNLHQGSSLRRRRWGALPPPQRQALTLSAMSKGRPLVLLLTPGNVHDCKVAQRWLDARPPGRTRRDHRLGSNSPARRLA